MQPQLTTTPRKLPVFVFPQSITFYLDDQSTHKQVLTLYNPYDFPVKFKVLCTAPNKYKVVDPEGTIKARCCVDIVVRHTALLIANCNATDKFRIQMQEHPSKQVMGKRDVEARLLNGTSETTGRATPDHEMFQQLPTNENRQQQSYTLLAQNRAVDKGTNYVALIAGIICIVALLLPTEGERNHRVPDYLHLSINFKLIFSFVLGMVTIIVLRL
ncbi:motile sperm domain-containing protein 1 isoform X2 [Cephus cinctus]|uniref:Motile sperm domain-containing protein 3 n=1 Tax=Cephus cinctus TaxID=211228 RepID=A0AAJ7BM32_CEPCN|nr:motile sperm domain-containing protein 1 isoform X2 [Cephus cinctus]